VIRPIDIDWSCWDQARREKPAYWSDIWKSAFRTDIVKPWRIFTLAIFTSMVARYRWVSTTQISTIRTCGAFWSARRMLFCWCLLWMMFHRSRKWVIGLLINVFLSEPFGDYIFLDKLFPPSIYCQLIIICYFQVTELMQEVFQRRSDAVSLPLVLVGAKNDTEVVKKVSRLIIILWQFSLKNFMMRGLVYNHTNFFLSLSEYKLRQSVSK